MGLNLKSIVEQATSPAVIGGVGGYAIGGPVGGLIGASIGSGIMGQEAQAQANATNLRIAGDQMAFQERLSNSAYQRATEDMRAAGLNPMVAYSQGGASTPSGSMTSVQPEDSIAKAFGNAASTALQARSVMADVSQKEADVNLKAAAAETQKAQTVLNINSAKHTDLKVKQAQAELPAQQARAKAEKIKAEYDKAMQPYDSWIQRIRQGIGTIGDAVGVIKPKINIQAPAKQQPKPQTEKTNAKQIDYDAAGNKLEF